MNEQISLFDIDTIFSLTNTEGTKAIDKAITLEEITEKSEKQKNKKVAYDVGDKIGGARKDLAQQRISFLSKPTFELLQEIEIADSHLAEELLTKKLFFDWFNLESAKENDLEPSAAKGLQLTIRRLPTNSKGLDRIKYFKSMQFISEEFKLVKTYNHFQICIQRLAFMVNTKLFINRSKRRIDAFENEISWTDDQKKIADYQSELQIYTGHYNLGTLCENYYLDSLGSFYELLNSVKKRKDLYEKIIFITDWDKIIPAKATNDSKPDKGAPKKSAWTRELPAVPQRIGQNELQVINKPNDFKDLFGFQSVEFGNYVDDDKAMEHLTNASIAYQDLANILNIPIQAISLKNELAMAFGSRGRGNALGHYERSYHVINLTKERGVLGVLAHEWFHAYDRFVYTALVNENSTEMITEKHPYGVIPDNIHASINKLVNVMTKGNSKAYQDVSAFTGSYTFRRAFKDTYESCESNLFECMESFLICIDHNIQRTLTGYIHPDSYEKRKNQLITRRKKKVREYAEALSQYHHEVTGEKITMIPYPSEQTDYYNRSITCDKGKRGKYWSSTVEMAARAFEAFIIDELNARGWTNDYLVCGITEIYPEAEERMEINKAMREFLKETKKLLI
ncbi:LPD1 domain-containing protein [Viridibacillus arvi]|uniref:LPD1 domain-containing protein n=1 Tax=Viridibacillus arvi TaxID=263475 RepID=UPI003D28EFBE